MLQSIYSVLYVGCVADYFSRGDNMSQFRSTDFPVSGYPNRFNHVMQHTLRSLLCPITRPKSFAELLHQVEEVTNPHRLTKVINTLQSRLWNLPAKEQTLLRERLADVLTLHVLQSPQVTLQLESAGWLRMLVQAALLRQPQQVFVTLVTAAVRSSTIDYRGGVHELGAYLQMVFDCFWPFRYPYAAFNWEVFPTNEVFYPLAPLLSEGDDSIQDTLLTIFAELPTLDDAQIEEHLLPVALQWSKHADAERRQRITDILARMSHSSAQQALYWLQSDVDPVVRARARRAAENVRRA